jgi:3-deoxy-D-manno-octulosonic-acid transferase
MDNPGAKPTLLYHVYKAATVLLAPFAWWLERRKLKRTDVPVLRQWERLGHATQPRPPARVIWLHGASVGESLSALTLIQGLAARLPQAEFLVTSGTPSSAKLVDQRKPLRTRHQFAPLDALGPVTRFLDHWNPDAAIFVESELWPLTLTEARDRALPLALVNARLSDRSVEGWCKYPDTAAFVLGHFRTLIAQNPKAADNLRRMGAAPDRLMIGGNLKAFAPPPVVDQAELHLLQAGLGKRPLWAAASTHPGEEDAVLTAHVRLLERHPDLCLLLIPRHPERGDDIAALIGERGLSMTRRSAGDEPSGQVYLSVSAR